MQIQGTTQGIGKYTGADKRSEDYESYRYDDFGDDMSRPLTSCQNFQRRHDFDTFNMSTYMSCENCRHLSSESQCIVGKNKSMNRLM